MLLLLHLLVVGKLSAVALYIRSGTPEAEGNVRFDGLTVVDSMARPWLQVVGDSNGWGGVSLRNVSVTNPHGCAADTSHLYGTHPAPAGKSPAVDGLASVRCSAILAGK